MHEISSDGFTSVVQLSTLLTMEHPAFTLSGLCAFGGAMGYMRKGSVPSLVAGIVLGSSYAYLGFLLKQNADYGLEIALASSAILLVAGIGRAIPTKFKKPLPLMLTALGSISTFYYTKKYNEFYPMW